MRWIWLDRIVTLEKAARCVAVKAVSAGEEPVWSSAEVIAAADREAAARVGPFLPHTLVVEGMAQCAGILVGHANDFREKVILAKIGKAVFTDVLPAPGYTLRFEATLDRLDPSGAMTTGRITRLDPATGDEQPLADLELMFSHIDRNLAGLGFPEHNFVFTDQFMDLLRRSGVS